MYMNIISSVAFLIWVACSSWLFSSFPVYVTFSFGRDIVPPFTNWTSILSILLVKFSFLRSCCPLGTPKAVNNSFIFVSFLWYYLWAFFTSLVKLKSSVTSDIQVGLGMPFNIGTRIYNSILAIKSNKSQIMP